MYQQKRKMSKESINFLYTTKRHFLHLIQIDSKV